MKKEALRLTEVQKVAIQLIKEDRIKEVLPMTLRALHGKGVLAWVENKYVLAIN